MMMIKFLLISLLVISPIFINSDKDLVTMECHNARVPTICMQCLESDPNSVTSDAVGIAGSVLNCLYSNLKNLDNNITDLLSPKNGEISDAIKIVLEICQKDLYEAYEILPEAKNVLENRYYEKAGQYVTMALASPLRCKDNFQTAKFQSLNLFSQINTYAQLSDAASRIIDRL